MKTSFAAIAVLLASCAATPVSPPSSPMSYMTEDTCHPDVPLLDSKNPGVVAPRLISRVAPRFPEDVRAMRKPTDELIVVEAVIEENGSVSDVCPIKGDPRFVQAVMDAVRQWKFSPGTIDGRPSRLRFNLTSTFKLR